MMAKEFFQPVLHAFYISGIDLYTDWYSDNIPFGIFNVNSFFINDI